MIGRRPAATISQTEARTIQAEGVGAEETRGSPTVRGVGWRPIQNGLGGTVVAFEPPYYQCSRSPDSLVYSDRRFCSSAGNEFFAEVPRDYLLDEFNWLNLTVDRYAYDRACTRFLCMNH